MVAEVFFHLHTSRRSPLLLERRYTIKPRTTGTVCTCLPFPLQRLRIRVAEAGTSGACYLQYQAMDFSCTQIPSSSSTNIDAIAGIRIFPMAERASSAMWPATATVPSLTAVPVRIFSKSEYTLRFLLTANRAKGRMITHHGYNCAHSPSSPCRYLLLVVV